MANHALKNRDNGLWCKPPRHLPTLVRVTYLDVTGVITSRRLSSESVLSLFNENPLFIAVLR